MAAAATAAGGPEAPAPAPPYEDPAETRAPGSDVERRCASLARSAGPLRRALSAIAFRFMAKPVKGWERLGFARASDYARERLGLSGRELYELARVHAALATLPRLEAALVSGALPWTKVRLVARAARPEDEERWIAYARRVTASALETEVRAVDAGSIERGGAEPDFEPTRLPRKGVCYEVPAETSAKWQFGWRLARRVAGRALDPGEAAEHMLAEVLSALPAEAVAQAEEAAEAEAGVQETAPLRPPRGRPAAERRAARWDQRREAAKASRREPVWLTEARAELPEFLKALVEGLEEADPFELDRRLRRAVALEQRFEARLGPWLERVAASRLYRGRGFSNLDAYARERLGMSSRKAWALLRIERTARICPALREAYREGHLSWIQTQALVPVLLMHPACAAAWIAFARQVPVRRLRDDVDRAVLLAERDAAAFPDTAGVPELSEGERLKTRARPTSSEATYRPPESGVTASRRAGRRGEWTAPGMGRIFFTAPADVARLFKATVCTVQRHLGPGATPGDALDALLEHCFTEWARRDPAERKERYYRIYQRDGWRCAVPGCGSYRNLHCHHKRYRSHQGDEADENLITLCAWHHLRAQHRQRWVRITGRETTRFELGVRPDAPPLLVYESSSPTARQASSMAASV